MAKKNQINKNDFDRVLLTETLPHEMPLNFATDGLYLKVRGHAEVEGIGKILLDEIVFNERRETIPYRYKINKTHGTFRRLALLHPNSQWMIRNFYKKYSGLMLFYTSKSLITIRSPDRIASTFYNKGSWENIYKYKNSSVVLMEFDRQTKHLPSFFAYRGYDRLWKFFNSGEYVELEKRFSSLLSMDVARCFDSIYTHCLSWATKSKSFTKSHLEAATFGGEFDYVLRHGNHSETNGIPIGPEVSRIFAEIILQRVDSDVVGRLAKSDFLLNVHYSIRRYVDDIYIYAKSESIAAHVQMTYSDCLLSFNLHPNSQKANATLRPFVTAKSNLVSQALLETEKLVQKIFQTHERHLTVKVIREPAEVFKKYLERIKSICHENSLNYFDISSLLIAVFNERLKKLCELDAVKEEESFVYFEAIKFVLDICFFLYSVAPSVSASYKLSTSIILGVRFFKANFPTAAEQLCMYVYSCIVSMLEEGRPSGATVVEEFVDLEAINIVLAAKELGDDLMLPPELVRRVFLSESLPTYFSLTSCLFYIGDITQFQSIQRELISHIGNRLSDVSLLKSDSQTAHLFFDAISCPFIPTAKRSVWLRAALKSFGQETTKADAQLFLENQANWWKVSWNHVDLLNVLEKKELKSAY